MPANPRKAKGHGVSSSSVGGQLVVKLVDILVDNKRQTRGKTS
jgi:hypothetical protein